MRQSILEKIEELAGKILKPDYVYINSGLPVLAEELPLINIVARIESAELRDQSPRSYEKSLIINVECYSSGDSFYEASKRANEMSEAVEAMVETDNFLNNNKERETFYTSTEFDQRSEGEGPIATAVVSFNVRFVECARDLDEECLDNLKEIAIGWKVSAEETCENVSNKQTIEL